MEWSVQAINVTARVPIIPGDGVCTGGEQVVHNEIWMCPRCGAQNEVWRRWCRSCPATQPPAVVENAPQYAQPIAQARRDRDRVHPAIAIGVIVAILLGGIGGFVLLRPSHSNKAQTAATDSSSSAAPALDNDQVLDAIAWKADDAPSGWSYSEPSSVGAQNARVGTSCGGDDPSAPHPHKMAPVIKNGDYIAMEFIDLQPTTQAVIDEFNKISSGALIDCLRSDIVDTLGPVLACSCTGINANVVPMTAPPNAPDTSYAFRLTIDRNGYVGAQLDVYFIGSGRSQVALVFLARGSNFPADAESILTNRTIKRIWDTPTTDKTY